MSKIDELSDLAQNYDYNEFDAKEFTFRLPPFQRSCLSIQSLHRFGQRLQLQKLVVGSYCLSLKNSCERLDLSSQYMSVVACLPILGNLLALSHRQ